MTLKESIEFEKEWLDDAGYTKANVIIALTAIKHRVEEQQPCEDCISRESVIEWLKDKDIIKMKNQEENARRELAALSSVTPSYNLVKTELKPSEDCISREDTLNKINTLVAEYIPLMPTGWTLPLNIAKTINELPSVTPQPKTGHWISDVDRWGDVVTTVNGYRCDKCNAFNSDKDNFCPNCGADMRGDSDEVDN